MNNNDFLNNPEILEMKNRIERLAQPHYLVVLDDEKTRFDVSEDAHEFAVKLANQNNKPVGIIFFTGGLYAKLVEIVKPE